MKDLETRIDEAIGGTDPHETSPTDAYRAVLWLLKGQLQLLESEVWHSRLSYEKYKELRSRRSQLEDDLFSVEALYARLEGRPPPERGLKVRRLSLGAPHGYGER